MQEHPEHGHSLQHSSRAKRTSARTTILLHQRLYIESDVSLQRAEAEDAQRRRSSAERHATIVRWTANGDRRPSACREARFTEE